MMIDLTKLQSCYKITFEESYNYAGELDRADANFPIMEPLHNGDGEGVYLFNADNLELLDAIARIIHAHKKRRLSEKQKKQAVERLKAYRFKKQAQTTPKTTESLPDSMPINAGTGENKP